MADMSLTDKALKRNNIIKANQHFFMEMDLVKLT